MGPLTPPMNPGGRPGPPPGTAAPATDDGSTEGEQLMGRLVLSPP